jgi:hypothetical protein
MRNSAALDQFDGAGDDLVGTDGELHELELVDVDEWEDETSIGDPAPTSSTTTAPAAKKAAPAKKAAAKKSTRGGRK